MSCHDFMWSQVCYPNWACKAASRVRYTIHSVHLQPQIVSTSWLECWKSLIRSWNEMQSRMAVTCGRAHSQVLWLHSNTNLALVPPSESICTQKCHFWMKRLIASQSSNMAWEIPEKIIGASSRRKCSAILDAKVIKTSDAYAGASPSEADMYVCMYVCMYVMYCIVLYCIVLYCIVLYCIVLYCMFVCLFVQIYIYNMYTYNTYNCQRTMVPLVVGITYQNC